MTKCRDCGTVDPIAVLITEDERMTRKTGIVMRDITGLLGRQLVCDDERECIRRQGMKMGVQQEWRDLGEVTEIK